MTPAITWTNGDLSSKVFCDTHPITILQDVLKILIHEMSLKMTSLKL